MMTNTVLLALVLLFSILETNSHAYIELGTGSFALQIALATAMGTLFVVREKMRTVFSLRKAKGRWLVDSTATQPADGCSTRTTSQCSPENAADVKQRAA